MIFIFIPICPHVQTLKAELAACKTDDLQFYFGCEAEYDPVNRGVGITEETAEKFDFIYH